MESILSNNFEPSIYYDWYDFEWYDQNEPVQIINTPDEEWLEF